jgi:hypothetical protein
LSEIFISPNCVECIVVCPVVSGTYIVIGVQCYRNFNSFFWLKGKIGRGCYGIEYFLRSLKHRRNLKLLEVISI